MSGRELVSGDDCSEPVPVALLLQVLEAGIPKTLVEGPDDFQGLPGALQR